MVSHDAILRGYAAAANDLTAPPLILKRADQEFIPAVLDGLRRGDSPPNLGRPGTDDYRNGRLHLHPPVHRTFNVVVAEVICRRPGSPRLNPAAIVSAGLVVRRVRQTDRPEWDEAWQHHEDRVLGWRRPDDPRLDPDPALRPPRLPAGHRQVNNRLARLFHELEQPAERFTPLFLAPPDVCTDARKTLLYGVLPVTSAEHPSEPEPFPVDADLVADSMPSFLRALGRSGRPAIGAGTLSAAEVNRVVGTDPTHPLAAFIQELRLIQFGWRAFDAGEGAAILPLLNEVTLLFGRRPEPLGDYLQALSRRLILRTDPSPEAIDLPDVWPQPDAALAARIAAAVRPGLAARLQAEVPPLKRFEGRNEVYRVHAFVRVRNHEGCPPHLHWAEPTETFSIVRWWEGGAPIQTIELPDLDSESIKAVKPNVAFALPPKLAALLNQTKPADFLDGKAAEKSGLGLGWICSFSLPIITLCAFIVLNIFLGLLHIVFQWLFYVKICLPYPKPPPSSS